MSFTIVFEGRIEDVEGNPMKIESPFGKVVAVGIGNAFDKIEHIIDIEEAAEALLAAIRKNFDDDDDDGGITIETEVYYGAKAAPLVSKEEIDRTYNYWLGTSWNKKP